MIRVGQRVKFDPTIDWYGCGDPSNRITVTGTVVMVNHKHEWFSVQYGDFRTSFKFSQIGQEVKVL